MTEEEEEGTKKIPTALLPVRLFDSFLESSDTRQYQKHIYI